MDNINQLYQALLIKEIESLEREEVKQHVQMTAELANRGMLSSGIYIQRVLEIESDVMRRFVRSAISEFIRLRQTPEADTDGLEQIYLSHIERLVSKTKQKMEDTIKSRMSPVSGNYFERDLEKLKSEAFRELDIAKAEEKFKLQKTMSPIINITGSAIGVLNLGNITGKIDRNIVTLRHSGHADTADAIKEFMGEIDKLKDEIGEKHLEILGHLEFLTEEANKPQEQRNIPVIKSVFRYMIEGISMSSGLLNIWDKIGHRIVEFFGLIVS